MIQKTDLPEPQINGTFNIALHTADGMIAKQRVQMVIDHIALLIRNWCYSGTNKTLVDRI
jgi:hypothetical protein